MTNLVPFIIGGILLFFGRKLFWLFVGVVGFIAGWNIVTHFVAMSPEWLLMSVALAIGCLGALLAFFVQKFAVGAAGFAGGGIVTVNCVESFGWKSEHFPWIVFLVGGVIGAILLVSLFEWALIVLSSITGAYLIVRQLSLSHTMEGVFLAIIAIAGIVVQAQGRRKHRAGKTPEKRKKKEEAE